MPPLNFFCNHLGLIKSVIISYVLISYVFSSTIILASYWTAAQWCQGHIVIYYHQENIKVNTLISFLTFTHNYPWSRWCTLEINLGLIFKNHRRCIDNRVSQFLNEKNHLVFQDPLMWRYLPHYLKHGNKIFLKQVFHFIWLGAMLLLVINTLGETKYDRVS